jgi:hypothetical protein
VLGQRLLGLGLLEGPGGFERIGGLLGFGRTAGRLLLLAALLKLEPEE